MRSADGQLGAPGADRPDPAASAFRTSSSDCRASGSASAATARRPRSTSAACRISAASRWWSTARGRTSSAPATTPTAQFFLEPRTARRGRRGARTGRQHLRLGRDRRRRVVPHQGRRRTCCGPASARARWCTRRSAPNQGRGLGSLFGAARANQNVDLFAGGIYRAQSDYKDGNGDIVPNSGNKVGSALGKVTVRPADGHEVKLGGLFQDFLYNFGQPNRGPVPPTSNQGTSVYRNRSPELRRSAQVGRYARPTTRSSIGTPTSTGIAPIRNSARSRTTPAKRHLGAALRCGHRRQQHHRLHRRSAQLSARHRRLRRQQHLALRFRRFAQCLHLSAATLSPTRSTSRTRTATRTSRRRAASARCRARSSNRSSTMRPGSK